MSFKFIKINAPFFTYSRKFDNPRYENFSYEKMIEEIEWDAVFLNGSWAYYLNKLGYHAEEIYTTVRPLQLKWAKEHDVTVDHSNWKSQIALEQIKLFKPDIVYSSDWDMPLLRKVRMDIPSVKLVIGGFGSYIPPLDGWEVCDFIVNPAPEAVQYLKESGFSAVHLNFGVDPRWLERTKTTEQNYDFTFSGALLLTPGTHRNRIEILDSVIRQFNDMRIGIFTDNKQTEKQIKKFSNGSWKFKFKRKIMNRLSLKSYVEDLVRSKERINKKAIKRIIAHNLGEVYGIDMLGIFQQSKIVFNVHASSSPTHASNFRLFEATLAGSCLLTDWKDNLPDLFEPDREIVTYRCVDEAVDKVRFLLNSESERGAIAKAGQQRTLRDHTLEIKAAELDEIIRRFIQ
jgi:spore maturation protein CgeB